MAFPPRQKLSPQTPFVDAGHQKARPKIVATPIPAIRDFCGPDSQNRAVALGSSGRAGKAQ
jgi:hypothetical protein